MGTAAWAANNYTDFVELFKMRLAEGSQSIEAICSATAEGTATQPDGSLRSYNVIDCIAAVLKALKEDACAAIRGHIGTTNGTCA